MLSGKTTLVAHLGYPTFAFKAPMIYNPWFEKTGIDAVVVPMGVQAPDYPLFDGAGFVRCVERKGLTCRHRHPGRAAGGRPGRRMSCAGRSGA